MTRPLTAAVLFVSCAFLAPLAGQTGHAGVVTDSPLQLADLAWERGDYPAALSAYLRLLDSPDAASVLEPIALRTGELYQSTELTRDGAVPQFSPDGRHLLYETGPLAGRVTRVVATADPARVVVELARRWRVVLARQREGRILEGGALRLQTRADRSTSSRRAARPPSTPERWRPHRSSSAPATPSSLRRPSAAPARARSISSAPPVPSRR